jgi:hypothetical protein
MSFIGDSTCKNNALSSKLRCAVNPDGPCEGCQYFEPVRERIMSANTPIRSISRQEMLARKLWSFAQYPMGMLQIACALTVLTSPIQI